MSDFGAQLKEAREHKGISLRQIATATKISMVALEALERNDFSRLPGGIFSRAFVRAYALEVGLDPEQTVQEFLVEYELNDNAAAEKEPPEVTADDRAFLERQRRAAWWLRAASIVVVLVLAAALIGWQVSRTKSAAAAEQAAGASRDLESAPAEVAGTRPATVDTAGGTAAPATSGASTRAGAAYSAPASASPPGTGDIQRTAPGADEVALHLEAVDECWTRVSVDGQVLLEQVLKPGETREIKPGRDVRLQVGNAGGLKWTINGQMAKELGKIGQTADVHVSRATLSKFVQ